MLALVWFKKIADAGDPDGMFNLGFMYGAGRGVPQDDKVQPISFSTHIINRTHAFCFLLVPFIVVMVGCVGVVSESSREGQHAGTISYWVSI